jgi:hypothetical protein
MTTPIYGYMRAPIRDEAEAEAMRRTLATFARQHGFALAQIFTQDDKRIDSAFDEMIGVLKRTHIGHVVIPSWKHFSRTADLQHAMLLHLRQETDAQVWVADADTAPSQAPRPQPAPPPPQNPSDARHPMTTPPPPLTPTPHPYPRGALTAGITLLATDTAVICGQALVESTLRRWQMPALIKAASDATVAIVTRAVRHRGTPADAPAFIYARLVLLPESVIVEVADPDPTPPPAGWPHYPLDDGKVVFVEFPTTESSMRSLRTLTPGSPPGPHAASRRPGPGQVGLRPYAQPA